ncbi:MAG TPA: arylsulfatase [Bryobacteraceae bacterium]|nr:arylsulfatase [Bryobacteraceae bacterium]
MTRREFMRSAAGVAGSLAAGSAVAAARPNIIVIMADDMGFSDLGCYGSEIATPNLDRLARNGVRFTQFYNTARCCPTRSALLTGLYNHQTGIGHMVQDRGLPGYRGFLNDRCVTIAEALRIGGYRTAMAGKWHVGEERPHWPVDRGFERYFGLISGASNYFRVQPGRRYAYNDQPWQPSGPFYLTDAFTDHAIQFLEEFGRGTQPWFLYLAYTAPHWPLHALPDDIAKYEGRYLKGWDVLRRERHARQIELGIVDRRWPLTPRDSQAAAWESVDNKRAQDRRMAVYAAQIDRMDQNVGRLLARLRELGQEQKTLILFLADNGGCAEMNIGGEVRDVPPGGPDSFTSYGLPWANASNTPFRLYKHWVHEGGIASPLIAHWPAGLRHAGRITHEPAHVIDIMATCLDVAGARYPAEHNGRSVLPLEGRSFAGVLSGRRTPANTPANRTLYWEHEGNRAVREGNQKLVSHHPDGWELYDLDADRTELNNLAPRQVARVDRMRAMYEAWAAKCNVQPWDEIRGRKPA